MQSRKEIFLYTLGATIITQLLFGVVVYHVKNENTSIEADVISRSVFDDYLTSSLRSDEWRKELNTVLESSIILARRKREESGSKCFIFQSH